MYALMHIGGSKDGILKLIDTFFIFVTSYTYLMLARFL